MENIVKKGQLKAPYEVAEQYISNILIGFRSVVYERIKRICILYAGHPH